MKKDNLKFVSKLKKLNEVEMSSVEGGNLLIAFFGMLFETPAIVSENVGPYGQHVLFK